MSKSPKMPPAATPCFIATLVFLVIAAAEHSQLAAMMAVAWAVLFVGAQRR